MLSFIPEEWLWLAELLFGFFLIGCVSLILYKVLSKLSKSRLIHKVRKIIYHPLQIAVWGIGICLILDVACTRFGWTRLAVYVRHLALALTIICVGWIALRWVRVGFESLGEKAKQLGINLSTLRTLSKMTSITVATLSLLILFQIFGLNIVPLITFGGIGMAGVAFAAQDIISNFFGGMMLHFTQPFEIGDYIEIPSQNLFQGRVLEIGWYGTKLRDTEKREVFFPNALFNKSYVVNLSKRSHSRIQEKLFLRYQDVDKVLELVYALRKEVARNPKIDTEQNFYIALSRFGLNGAELLIDLLTFEIDPTASLQLKQDILLLSRQMAKSFDVQVLPLTYVQNYASG